MDDLNVRLSAVAVDYGMWMQPLFRRDGTMLWPRFDDDPNSHVLLAYQPGKSKQALDLLEMMSFDPAIDVVRTDLMKSHRERRAFIRDLAARVDTASRMKTIVVIDGLDSLVGGLRRESTLDAVLRDLEHVLAHGPAVGVHVVLLTSADDESAKMVSGLGVAWHTQALVGSMSPVVLAALCPSCPVMQNTVVRKRRCAVIVLSDSRSRHAGLVDIRR